MKLPTRKKCLWMLMSGTFVLSLAWATTAFAVNLQVGGGQPLDLSRFQVVHQETFEISGKMNGNISGAGLLCGFDPQTRNYLAFIKGAGRSYAIYKKIQMGCGR